MREITLSEFMDSYEKGFLTEVVYIKDKVYARSMKGKDSITLYEIVYAVVP